MLRSAPSSVPELTSIATSAFRLIYHDIAAGAQLDDRRMDRVDLVFDLKPMK